MKLRNKDQESWNLLLEVGLENGLYKYHDTVGVDSVGKLNIIRPPINPLDRVKDAEKVVLMLKGVNEWLRVSPERISLWRVKYIDLIISHYALVRPKPEERTSTTTNKKRYLVEFASRGPPQTYVYTSIKCYHSYSNR